MQEDLMNLIYLMAIEVLYGNYAIKEKADTRRIMRNVEGKFGLVTILKNDLLKLIIAVD